MAIHEETPPRRAGRPDGTTRASWIYDQIQQRLLNGEYAAGQKLRPLVLAEEFQVSREPVARALDRLAEDRLVEITPRAGCRVAVYTLDDVRDFFAVFGGFEGKIAALAAERRTDAQLAALSLVHNRIGALRTRTDPQERSLGYRLGNRHWHGVVHEMAHSPLIADAVQRWWRMSDFLINTAGVPANPLSTSLDGRHADHSAVYEALYHRDPETARRAMEAHIIGTIGIINREVEENGNGGSTRADGPVSPHA